MKFKKGDIVKVISNQYGFDKFGLVGTIEKYLDFNGWVEVDFTKLSPQYTSILNHFNELHLKRVTKLGEVLK